LSAWENHCGSSKTRASAIQWYNLERFVNTIWYEGVNNMGLQLIEFAAWARNRKIVASLLVTVTLAIGIVIGTVASGRVGASHPASASDATPLAIPDPVQLSSAFASM